MHVLFALPGLHKVRRGAEVVFESLAQEIAREGTHRVTLVGSGQPIDGRAYEFRHVGAVPRERFERFPKFPFLRSEFMYEEITFAAGLLKQKPQGDADITVSCGYPYTNWALRRPAAGRRPPQVFVTQNGDWAASKVLGEPMFFSCEGLVCTNPVYFERNRERWPSTLIPNGIDPDRFTPGRSARGRFGLPDDQSVILMVSALQHEKRIIEAMRAVAAVPDTFLLIAGDGPIRDEVDRLAAELLPGRFRRASFAHDEMPDLYRSADIFLHATIGEPFGNVYIEALSSGTPVLAHDEALTRWILGDYATLVDTRSVAAFSAAIEALVSGPRATSDEGSQWARRTYGWPVVARSYVSFLEQVLAGNARR